MSYSYTLEAWQEKAFTDTFSLYKPTNLTLLASGQAQDLAYPSSATYTGIPGLLHATDNAYDAALAGRQFRADLYITQDRFSFHVEQEIGDGWLVKLTTPDHPEEGTFWIAHSDKKNRGMSKKATIRGEFVIAPAGVT